MRLVTYCDCIIGVSACAVCSFHIGTESSFSPFILSAYLNCETPTNAAKAAQTWLGPLENKSQHHSFKSSFHMESSMSNSP